MGGLNWAGLPLICGWLGVTDMEGLLERLAIIKKQRQQQQKKDE